jgi:hypothetical protein
MDQGKLLMSKERREKRWEMSIKGEWKGSQSVALMDGMTNGKRELWWVGSDEINDCIQSDSGECADVEGSRTCGSQRRCKASC